nr:AF211540_1 Avr9/Cf-9 rapidly elicited protein 75 [Ipomoea batatas]GMC96752.1 AF211540_1 Avr9/Cf-9 rapidly elicited protein 75 [Ipomoea batatas]
MAWSCEPEMACKKHSNRRQQPGVCSICLRERLSKIPGAVLVSSPPSAASSASYSPRPADYCYSSGSSSGRGSPRGHRRITSDVVSHFSFIFSVAGVGALKKSRSIAIVAKGGAGSSHGAGKKKEGFWSKLIRSTGKKTRRVFLP